ncbi:type II secretion system F family protein [Frankia gtarii]|uniref:type II secretion system F family protein n=1 Tax=Frankia gtarii TaxID=2950102 RepID=UPI0021BF0A56|nr:type II secretion system F family protein [Frankia gtarii]
MTRMLLVAACGALTGLGVWQAARSLLARKPDLGADLAMLFTAPATTRTPPLTRLSQRLCTLMRDHGLGGLLRGDDVTIAGRGVDAHMAARLLHLLAGAAAGLTLAALTLLVAAASPVLPGLLVVGAALGGLLLADRPVLRLAHARRRDAALATAVYIDLVRILLVGGLPLPAALSAAADSGHGWTFTHLRRALAGARLRGIPPDVAVAELADTYPLREFTDLARTLAAARSGASPVLALQSRAAAIRHADSARLRGQEAAVDAQMDLPAAAVALVFVAFLTYPLLTMINSSVGI